MNKLEELNELGKEAVQELAKAEKKFPGFNSAHEGYAVLLEEVDELWDEIKINPKKILPRKNFPQELALSGDALKRWQKKQWYERMREEAVQVAAMGLKFMKFIDDESHTCHACGEKLPQISNTNRYDCCSNSS